MDLGRFILKSDLNSYEKMSYICYKVCHKVRTPSLEFSSDYTILNMTALINLNGDFKWILICHITKKKKIKPEIVISTQPLFIIVTTTRLYPNVQNYHDCIPVIQTYKRSCA